jgi:SNF2 family DNA or RNA helicase
MLRFNEGKVKTMFPKVTWGRYASQDIRMNELPEDYLLWIIDNFSDRYIRVCARNILNGKDTDVDPGLFVILDYKEPDLVLIDAPYCLKEYIKELPDRQWNPELKKWTTKLEFYDDVFDVFPDSTISDKLSKALKQRTDLQSTLYEHNFINDSEINTYNPLRDYQRAALVFMLKRPGSLIALDMGLGKTLVTLEYLLQSKQLPALVVCPAIVKGVWVGEIERWTDYTSNGGLITLIKSYQVVKHTRLTPTLTLRSSIMI